MWRSDGQRRKPGPHRALRNQRGMGVEAGQHRVAVGGGHGEDDAVHAGPFWSP